jgi:hypothetical protein
MDTTIDGHHHRWVTRSTHHTSEGHLHYQHCACGQWRVALMHEVEGVSHVVRGGEYGATQ